MKALVELDGPRSQPFKAFVEQRKKWMLHDLYRAPGESGRRPCRKSGILFFIFLFLALFLACGILRLGIYRKEGWIKKVNVAAV